VRWYQSAKGMPRKDEYRIRAEILQLLPSRRTETTSSFISRMQSRERRAQRAPKDALGGRSSLGSPHQSSPTQQHCVKRLKTCNQKHRRRMGEACGTPCSSICHNKNFRKQVCQYRLPFRLTMTL
jgi:hypothetical protein